MWRRSGQEVATFCIDVPGTRNALNPDALEELSSALMEIAVDLSVRVVVLTGAGSVLCSGADRSALQAPESLVRLSALLGTVVQQIADLPQPVICRANGDAYGGGVALLSACDIVIANRGAQFAFPEPRFGMVATVAAACCVGLIGQTAALDLFLTGRRFGVEEAQRVGLVTVGTDGSDLDATVQQCVDDVLLGDPMSIAHTKRLIRHLGRPLLREALTEAIDPPDDRVDETVQALRR